jgi:hypothetical protein
MAFRLGSKKPSSASKKLTVLLKKRNRISDTQNGRVYRIRAMTEKDNKILRKHIDEILDYQVVLSKMLKKKVSLDQAVTDWIAQGYSTNHRKKHQYY